MRNGTHIPDLAKTDRVQEILLSSMLLLFGMELFLVEVEGEG